MVEQNELSIIIPAYNEGARIVSTIHALLFGLPEGAEVFVVFNGCTDGSDSLLDDFVDHRLRIITLQRPSKSLAIRAAEEEASKYPRFYVDADVEIKGSALKIIATALREEKTELASPRLTMDFSECSRLARAASETWMRLPHSRSEAYQAVIGVSRAGRARWGEMPELIADDSFITSCIDPSRRLIIKEATAIVHPPRDLWSFIRVRVRLEQGRREFQQNNIKFPQALGQRQRLISLLLNLSTSFDAFVYIFGVLCARIFLFSGLYTKRRLD
jgi:glycosyltransferase involved in cell wall biosynthesis